MDDILLDTMFDLPGRDNVVEVVVNEEAVGRESEPLLVFGDSPEESASAS